MLILDIIYIEGKPIFNIVDSFNRFLRYLSTKAVWETNTECGPSICTGLPNKMKVDHGSQFQDRLVTVGRSYGVDVAKSWI